MYLDPPANPRSSTVAAARNDSSIYDGNSLTRSTTDHQAAARPPSQSHAGVVIVNRRDGVRHEIELEMRGISTARSVVPNERHRGILRWPPL